jgi:hypothetical protein
MITSLSIDELKAAGIISDTILKGLNKLEIQYNRHPDKEPYKREFVLGLLVAYGEDVKTR